MIGLERGSGPDGPGRGVGIGIGRAPSSHPNGPERKQGQFGFILRVIPIHSLLLFSKV